MGKLSFCIEKNGFDKSHPVAAKELIAIAEKHNIQDAPVIEKINVAQAQLDDIVKQINAAVKKSYPELVAPAVVEAAEVKTEKTEKTTAYGEKNKVVTKDRAAEIKAKLRAKMNQLNAGMDPEMMALGTELAVYHIEAGARSFVDFSKRMLQDLGEKARPFLKSWYMAARYYPDLDTAGMDEADAVDRTNVDEINDLGVIETYPGIEGTEFHVIKNEGGYAVGMMDTDINKYLPTLRIYKGHTEENFNKAQAYAAEVSADSVARNQKNDILDEKEAADVAIERGSEILERDRTDTETADEVGQDGLQPGAGTDVRAGVEGVQRTDQPGAPAQGSVGIRPGETVVTGKRGDQSVYTTNGQLFPESSVAGNDFDQRSGDGGLFGEGIDPASPEAVSKTAQSRSESSSKLEAQKAAQNIPVILGDSQNVDEALPFLQEGQRKDVVFAENRLSQPTGYGVMFTNGTGTGKTYSGLGIIKRYERQGKKNILIVVPDDDVALGWTDSGRNLGLNISRLENTKDNGREIVITTYANMGQNDELAKRDWDLIVQDEAHSLMQGKEGKPTAALHTLRAISNHPGGKIYRFNMLYREQIEQRKELKDRIENARKLLNHDDTMDQARAKYAAEIQQLEAEAKELDKYIEKERSKVYDQVDKSQGASRTRVAFLSATPFAYEKTIDLAEGYLFEYPEDGYIGNSRQGGFEKFMVEHFGYRIRYHKLTEPEAEVNRGLMQRQFNTWLKEQRVLSGRMLDVTKDYDRKFVLTENAIGTKIDEGLEFLWDNDRYSPISEIIREKFDYLSRRYLLEAIKAREVIPLIKEHMALGRKVVVFHDYKKGGGFNPFDLSEYANSKEEVDVGDGKMELGQLVREFMAERQDLANIDLNGLLSPIDSFSQNFAEDELLIINGNMSKKHNAASYKKFNDDAAGPQVMLIQSAKNAGWSGHDTTGKHQRVIFNLGLPTRPTMAIQQEGRIYRVGQASNAMFRYLNTGTNWERIAFAETIATRSSVAENLALGEEARALLDSFIEAFEDSDLYPAGHAGEGTGGKERDAAANAALTEWDRATTLYWSQLKKTSRTKAMEGKDYFATPEPLGLKMVEWAGLRGGERGLEPSAGHGAIARWFPENVDKTVIEPSTELSSRLKMATPGSKLIQSNFEDHNKINKYDAVVMNPPFGVGGKQAVEHLKKATDHLRDGGRVVALIPTGPAADKRFDKWFYGEDEKGKPLAPNLYIRSIVDLPQVTFERAGTRVAARIVVIDKVMDPGEVVQLPQRNRDFTRATTIKEFFEDLEDASVPDRIERKVVDIVPELNRPATPAVDAKASDVTVTFNAEKKGIELRFPGKPSDEVREAMKGHRFRWSKFQKMWYAQDTPERRAFAQSLQGGDTVLETPEGYGTINQEVVNEEQLAFNFRSTASKEDKAQSKKLVKNLVRANRKKPTLLGNAITAGLAAEGGISLVGQKVETAEELATLAQVYRNPQYETFRVFYTKKGEVVGQNAVSSRLPGASYVFEGPATAENSLAGIERMKREMERLGADGYWMLHNHPSGHTAPSREDAMMSARFNRDVDGFKGHVVINHNEYSTMDISLDQASVDAATHVKLFSEQDKFLKPSMPHPVLGRRITEAKDLVAIGAELKTQDGYFSLISRNKAGVRGIMEVPLDSANNPKRLAAIVRNFSRQTGAQEVFAILPEGVRRATEMMAGEGVRDGYLVDAVYSSGQSIRGDYGISPMPERYFGGKIGAKAVKEADENYQENAGRIKTAYNNATPQIKNTVDYLRMKFQDKFIPLMNLQKELEAAGWEKDELNDAYRAEELFHGRAARRLELFYDEKVQPLIDAINASDVTMLELEDYLYAMFAPERNAHIASINEKFPDGGSGMTNAEAERIRSKFNREGKTATLEELAAKAREMTQMQRQIIREEGLELDETIDAWEMTNDNYVPLKGGKEDKGKGIGTGFNVNRSGTKQALGRKSKADNILAHLFDQIGATIVRAEKATVGRAFLQMVEENPDYEGFEIYDMKKPETLPTKRKLVVNPNIKRIKRKIDRRRYALNNGSPNEAQAAKLQQEIMDFEIQLMFENQNTVRDVRNLAGLNEENVMTVTREDGSVVHINILNDDLARVMKNLTQNQHGKFVQAMAKTTRFLSMMSTSLNPEFIITNFTRDIQTAMVHLSGEKSATLAKNTLKGVPGAIKGIHSALRGDGTGEWAGWYNRFRDAGAQVSFMDLRGVDDWQKKLTNIADNSGMIGTTKSKLTALFDGISDYNTIVENATRLAAFRMGIEEGMSESDAASLAKNLTVNFNRKGELGPAMNAFYMFANAGVQGSARILGAMKSKRVQKMMGATVIMAIGLAELSRSMGGEDEDGEDRWDKVEDYVKQNNLVFLDADGNRTTIRLPYGYNWFVALGYTISDMFHGKEVGDSAGFLTTAFMNAFNPLGGSDGALKLLSPTLTDPLIEIATNENFMGSKIYPENFPFGAEKPKSQLYFRSASEPSKWITESLNNLTGGTKYDPGMIDVSPEVIDHFFDFFIGGAGRTVRRAVDAPFKMVDGTLEPNQIPFWRQVRSKQLDHVDIGRFYDNLKQVTNTRTAIKELPSGAKGEYRVNHPESKLYTLGNRKRRIMSDLRKRYYTAIDSGDTESAKRVKERMRSVALSFNKRYNDVVNR